MIVDFALPAELEAHDPPEARGVARDGVRLLVSRRGAQEVSHGVFGDLPGRPAADQQPHAVARHTAGLGRVVRLELAGQGETGPAEIGQGEIGQGEIGQRGVGGSGRIEDGSHGAS